MRHPFDLALTDLTAIDLEFAESLTDEEAEQVAGGIDATTLAVGEEGGYDYGFPKHWPPKHPKPVPIDPRPVTTYAVGEEGGGTTKAVGEEGGYTTLALGEEGGNWTQ